MEKKEKPLYRKIFCIRFTAPEYKAITAAYRQSDCRKLSEYVRDVLLNRPVTVYTKDKNTDDGMAALLTLRSELTAIGRNLNQAVRKLNRMDQEPSIIEWGLQQRELVSEIEKKIALIGTLTSKISARW